MLSSSRESFSVALPGLKARTAMTKRKRSDTSTACRELKRIALSLDTLLRKHYALPVDPALDNPQPVSTERCLEYLKSVFENASSSSVVTQVMSPSDDAVPR